MQRNKKDLPAWLMSGLFGIITSVFFVFGYQLETADALNLSDHNSDYRYQIRLEEL